MKFAATLFAQLGFGPDHFEARLATLVMPPLRRVPRQMRSPSPFRAARA